LVAAKLQIPIGHVESGLRSFDRSMPEEVNRIVADEFSDLLFLHSEDAVSNLRAEGIADHRMHFVGNTMIDSLVALEHRFRLARAHKALGVQPGDYLLVTLHRPALVDGPLLPEVISQLTSIARDVPVVFPVHPRTRRLMPDVRAPGLILVDPVSYIDFLSLEADAAAVLTDSGGVQEETTYLGVRCYTLRDNTERPVTVRLGTNRLLGLNPAGVEVVHRELLSGIQPDRRDAPPFWDGRAAERVADVVQAWAAINSG
jgi:UDP-N-acetylglucosamine 2-epimerase (non-hydrolysing)